MKVLVTGGAGYIGSHCVYELIRAGHQAVVFDNLSNGHREAIHNQATFVEGDIHDDKALDNVMQAHQFDAIIHFAASLIVPESMTHPLAYYHNNVNGVRSILEAMKRNHIKNIVFSSTAAVYGTPNEIPCTESTPTHPESPYGETKLAAEKMIHWASLAHHFNYVIFRYFNVAGADPSGSIGLAAEHITHIIPSTIEAAQGLRPELTIFGNDYDTKDGTCVRDYIHVSDLAKAHILGVDYLLAGKPSNLFNLGSSAGYSVKEIVDAVESVCHVHVPHRFGARRPGDPAIIVASNLKAYEQLGWQPEYTLEEMIQTDYAWRKSHPNGYK